MYITFNQNVTGNRPWPSNVHEWSFYYRFDNFLVSFDVASYLCLLTSNDQRVGQKQQSDDGTDPACVSPAHSTGSRIDVSSRPSSQCVGSVVDDESVGSLSSAWHAGQVSR